MDYNPDDPRFIAMHEAGHAVAAVLLGFPIDGVDVIRRLIDGKAIAGRAHTSAPDSADLAGKGEVAAIPHLIQIMAGPYAELITNRRATEQQGAQSDLEQAFTVAAFAICGRFKNGEPTAPPEEVKERSAEINALVEKGRRAAKDWIRQHHELVVRVAQALLQRQQLTGDELRGIIEPGSEKG